MVKLWIPKDDVFCYGNGGNQTWGSCSGGTSISWTNSYNSVYDSTDNPVVSLSGIDNYDGSDESTITMNNNASGSFDAREPGGWCYSYSNAFAQGCGAGKNGSGFAVSGASYNPGMTVWGASTLPWFDLSQNIASQDANNIAPQYGCFPVDTRYITFTGLKSAREAGYNYPNYTGLSDNYYAINVASNNTAFSLDCSSVSDQSLWSCLNFISKMTYEYSTLPNPTTDLGMYSSGCGDTEGNWQTYDPSQPAPAGVTKLRFKVEYLTNPGYLSAASVIMPKFDIKPGLSTGLKIPFFTKASADFAQWNMPIKYNYTLACSDSNGCGYYAVSDIFDNPGTNLASVKPDFAPYINSMLDTASPGYSFDSSGNDRITIVGADVAIDKTLLPDDTQINKQPGDILQYKIASTLVSVPGNDPAGVAVTISDVLPNYMNYVANSSNCDGTLCAVQPTVQADTPNSGQTTLKWTFVLPDDSPAYHIPELTYIVQLSTNIPNGSYTNIARISTPRVACSMDSDCSGYSKYLDVKTVNIFQPSAFYITKVAEGPLEVNSEGIFDLNYVSTSTEKIDNGQFIDILPYNTDPRGTMYNGTSVFSSLEIFRAENVEYTLAPQSTISEDPCHVSNIASGLVSTSVCRALPGPDGMVQTPTGDQTALSGDDLVNLVGGSVGTAATTWVNVGTNVSTIPAGVTAIRVTFATPANPILPNAGGNTIKYHFETNGTLEGDLFFNSFTARVENIRLPIYYNSSVVPVVGSSIGDTVWYDLDGDGVQDSGELGLPNVQVCITGGDNPNPPVDPTKLDAGADNIFGTSDDAMLCTMTDANGNYAFTNLHSGTYKVTVTPIAGTVETFDLDGLASVSNASFVLGLDQDLDTVDFGYRGTGSVSGVVYKDNDLNDTNSSGDTLMAGIIITLYDSNGDVVATTTTDANGAYSFTNLINGDYSIVETQPSGYASTENNTNEISVTINSNSVTDQNFGEINYAPIVGMVFVDITNAPISGVIITLKDSSGNVVATTTTDASGNYSFAAVAPGNYTIEETQPANYNNGVVNPSNSIAFTHTFVQGASQDFSEVGQLAKTGNVSAFMQLMNMFGLVY